MNDTDSTTEQSQLLTAEALYQQANEIFYNSQQSANLTSAFDLYKQAANQGHADSQRMLGDCYALGFATEVNPVKAGIWYKKSARQGNTDAMIGYAKLLIAGDGVQKDKKQAIEWLEKALQQGNFQARPVLEEAKFSKASKWSKNTLLTLTFIGILPWSIVVTLWIMPLLASLGIHRVSVGLLVVIILVPVGVVMSIIYMAFGEDPEIPEKWRE